ncbi:GTP-binding protein [Roseimarinus sediminis]|jgi:G3E family GTPase|uniref:GTP-binding protein n=1 Tax=Roseimarinus sediminis TaxID=1610899 RepID=UPI003D2071DE
MIPFYLITGFLGSGKTTFLKHLLSTLGERHRIAIIQNEFAPTGIDGKLLQENSPDFQLVEINNGSVFCACQLSNFEATLLRLLEHYRPELVFLEASGLADPINMAEILQSPSLVSQMQLRHIFCLADGENYFKGLKLITRFQHQLMIADTVIINKSDLVTPQNMAAIEEAISSKNPFAKIVQTRFGIFDFEPESQPVRKYVSIGQASGGRPPLQVSVLRNNVRFSMPELEILFQEIAAQSIRAKGIFHLTTGETVSAQSVFENIEMKEIEVAPGPNELIVFGGFTPRELKELAERTVSLRKGKS